MRIEKKEEDERGALGRRQWRMLVAKSGCEGQRGAKRDSEGPRGPDRGQENRQGARCIAGMFGKKFWERMTRKRARRVGEGPRAVERGN